MQVAMEKSLSSYYVQRKNDKDAFLLFLLCILHELNDFSKFLGKTHSSVV